MSVTLDVRTEHVLLDVPAVEVADVIDAAAAALAEHSAVGAPALRAALGAAIGDASFAVGAGIAVPHATVPGIARRVVAFARTASPLRADALDGAPVDLFFVVAYPPGDPASHLQFLAHLAALCRSRVFRDGLRAARTTHEVVELITAAEARLGGAHRLLAADTHRRGLAVISVTGERAADAILVSLLSEHLGSATIVDAQSVQDAASREVPLFAGFRDLFGDPGGRRVIFAQVDLEYAGALARIVERACEDERSAAAELLVMPITHHWEWRPTVDRPPSRNGH